MTSRCVSESATILSRIMQPSDANPRGIVHGGSMMKEIDNAAGAVAIKHSRHYSVTASIDRIDFHNKVFIGDLVTIKASLNAVGRSSMEVGVRVEAEDMITGKRRHVNSAYLTFVAIDENGKPVEVPQLICETQDEKRRNREAQNRKEMRFSMKAFEKKCQEMPDKC